MATKAMATATTATKATTMTDNGEEGEKTWFWALDQIPQPISASPISRRRPQLPLVADSPPSGLCGW
ncbi:hypothetical protein LWI29_033933 [Acer saccharum]|uniref:Uncharacterized protein n=1 Tax=Acer saccharum TaxID=4024 RepID=A0AA39SXN8_ACESA|nr:hypothetical protein LWI29_033933 [Acer saccharum]